MTNDRQYRRGMPIELACAILREHAGSQWDEQVVQQVVAVAATMPQPRAFDGIGRTDRQFTSESVPDDIRELLMVVDAEI